MKFSQCPFKTIFLMVATLKSGNLITNHSCDTKDYFYVLLHMHRDALTILQFKLDILHDSEPPHKKKTENIARFVTRLCRTLF